MSLQALVGSVDVRTLADQFFVYASSNCTGDECRALTEQADGLVLRPANRAILREMETLGFTGPVILDPAEYERRIGQPETVVQNLFGQDDALALQQEEGVAAYLSPSGYIPDGDVEVLAQVIEAGATFCADAAASTHAAPAFTVLALGGSWLSRAIDRRALTAQVRAYGQPIALVLGAGFDPLSSRSAVAGLIEFVDAVDDVFLLRADLNAIGGVAMGALCAAIGCGTATRHFRPPGIAAKRGGAAADKSPSTLWIPGGSFHRGSFFEHSHDDQGLLNCSCSVCEGRHLGRFGDPALRPESRLHSVAGWYQIAQNLIAREPEDRPQAWQKRCDSAVDALSELRRRTQIDYRSATAQIWKGVLG